MMQPCAELNSQSCLSSSDCAPDRPDRGRPELGAAPWSGFLMSFTGPVRVRLSWHLPAPPRRALSGRLIVDIIQRAYEETFVTLNKRSSTVVATEI